MGMSLDLPSLSSLMMPIISLPEVSERKAPIIGRALYAVYLKKLLHIYKYTI